MLTPDENAKLTKAGLQFDALVAGLPGLPEVAPGKTAAVDAEKILEQLASEHEDLTTEFDRLKEVVQRKSLQSADVRMAAARIIARWKLDSAEEDEAGTSDALHNALQEFAAKGRRETSAVDILASAILLPKEAFSSACFRSDHALGALASQFDVPVGLVSLRQHVLNAAVEPEPEPEALD